MTTDLLKPELSFLNNMDLPHKNAWATFSNYTLQLHMDFHGFKWLISFCACSFQISIIMFIFLYRLTGGDDHADQRGKACLKCFCDTFDSDRCMNTLTRRWMSICSRSMVWCQISPSKSLSDSNNLRSSLFVQHNPKICMKHDWDFSADPRIFSPLFVFFMQCTWYLLYMRVHLQGAGRCRE